MHATLHELTLPCLLKTLGVVDLLAKTFLWAIGEVLRKCRTLLHSTPICLMVVPSENNSYTHTSMYLLPFARTRVLTER